MTDTTKAEHGEVLVRIRGLKKHFPIMKGLMRRQVGAVRAVDGLSFGYRAKASRHEPAGRQLDEIELFEISLVTDPLQDGARVIFVS